MRVSEVMIEPVLRDAIVGHPLIDARWGAALEDFEQDAEGVTVTLRTMESGDAEKVRCDFLAGLRRRPAGCGRSSISRSKDGRR